MHNGERLKSAGPSPGIRATSFGNGHRSANISDNSGQNLAPTSIGAVEQGVPPLEGESVGRRSWSRADRKNLLIWVVIGLLAPAVFVWAALHVIHRPPAFDVQNQDVQNQLPTKALMAFGIALATWVVARREKRPLAAYGIPLDKAFGARFWEGGVWGFAMLPAVAGILGLFGHFRIESVALNGAAALRYGIGWGAVFLAVSINEELAFRGYWLFLMARSMRFWPAATFLSVLFAVAHLANPGETVIGILHVFVIGMFFCLTIRRTGTLWFALGFHATWDWAETFFFGTPDSGLIGAGHFLNTSFQGANWLTGGSTGPEGSVVALLVLLVYAVLIHLRFAKALYPDRPL
ncbi:MAG TPA: CPBP family intramembrane glutamic endopeptidase [Candidatus Eremiobacteraceae bacterium]|nr:CPBP family intramembrane glutamic endopeptidase [Candidatus Eremiobacteraceae bacterium]